LPLSKDKRIKSPKKTFQGDLPRTKEEWKDYTTKLHDDGLSRRLRHEFQWTLNLAYTLGYQDLVMNTRTGQLQIPQNVTRPLTINRIGSFVEARHAKLTKNRPVPRVGPNTTDQEDKSAAKAAEQLLKHLWVVDDQEAMYDKFVVLGLITGTSFIRTVWNPFIGDTMMVTKRDKDGVVSTDSDGGVQKEKLFMGEVSSEALTPFSIIPADEMIIKIKDQPWLMERSFQSISDLEVLYPHLKGKIKHGDHDDRTEFEKIVARLAGPITASVGGFTKGITDSINSDALVKTLFVRPNAEYENGVVCVVAGDQLAFLGEFPNDYGKEIYPYSKFSERTDGFHFWGQATVERLLSIQKSYNRLRQKKLKNIYKMANGKWMLAKGSQVMEDSLNDEEGEVIEYNSAVTEPHQATIAALPTYAREMPQELIDDMRDVSGQRESSLAPPPNITAGVALQILAEQSDEILSPIIRNLAKAMRITANQQLLIMNDEYTEKRKIQIFGGGNAAGVQWLSNADLRNHTDVHIDIESMFPDFKGSKRQALLDLWDRGIVRNPVDFLKVYRYGDFEKLVEKLEQVDDQVWLAITQIKDGKEPAFSPFQDHQAFFKVMSEWIQTIDFQRLIPERKELALNVLKQHINVLQQSLPNQGEAAPLPNQNAVGGPGGPTVPAGAEGNVGPQG